MIAKIFLALALMMTLAAAVDPEDAWNNFMAHHPMAFPTAEEAEQRKANFFSAHDVIEAHNNKPGVTYKLAHNSFSLLSAEEKKAFLGGRRPEPRNHTRTAFSSMLSERALPASVDYRTNTCMQPVKNQGQCGSCWAFATVALVEFNACIKSGKKVALSEQQLVDCSTANYGCNGGWQYKALQYIGKTGGIATSAAYPYTSSGGTSGSCKYNAAQKGAVVSASSPVNFIKAGDTTAMMTVLAAKGLVTVDIAVVNSFFSYKSGVYAEPNCGSNIVGYHAITAVGYGTLNGVPYWIIRNSWSSGWGAAGYILFKRGVNLCGVEDYPVGMTIV